MSPLVERVPRAAANRACRSLRRVALVSVAAGALEKLGRLLLGGADARLGRERWNVCDRQLPVGGV